MNGTEHFENQMDEEYLGEARDTVSSLLVVISNMRSGAASGVEGAGRIKRECVGLRQGAHWAEQPLIELTVRRMEAYLEAVPDPSDANLGDLEVFLYVIESILEGELDQNTDEAEFVRSLPVPRPVDLSDLEHLNIEILLVEPQRTSARIFERELQSGGYRVTRANRSYEALELAVRTKPDMVISSQVLDDLSGIDLCRAIAAIERTEEIPFALLTSYKAGDAALKGLPEAAAVIPKSAEFGEGLADAFARFHIT